MIDRRPLWGIIVWLNLCVVIWLFTVQEPVMTEGEGPFGSALAAQISGAAAPANSIVHELQPQQNYAAGNGRQMPFTLHRQPLAAAPMPPQASSSPSTATLPLAPLDLSTTTTTKKLANNELAQFANKNLDASDEISHSNYRYQIDETSRQYGRRLNSNKIKKTNSYNRKLIERRRRQRDRRGDAAYYSPSSSSTTTTTTTTTTSKRPAAAAAAPLLAVDDNSITSAPQVTPYPGLLSDENVTDARQLIDLHNFQYLMTQAPCAPHTQALILVHSAPRNFKKRSLIRKTWGNAAYLASTPLRVLFLLGSVKSSVQKRLRDENAKYGDMVQGSFRDAYVNMTYKHVMALKWFHYHCASASLLIKVDDDVYVNTPQLLKYVEQPTLPEDEVLTKVFQQPQDLIYCDITRVSRVKRSYRSKWRVSFKQYDKRYYPPYCPGYAIIYSADVVHRLYRSAQQASYFWIDDVHITGVLAQRNNITLTDLKYILLGDDFKGVIEHTIDPKTMVCLFSVHDITKQEMQELFRLYTRAVASQTNQHQLQPAAASR